MIGERKTRIIVLVGPPGVGKSTLVLEARKMGVNATDIEDLVKEGLSKEEIINRIPALLDSLPAGITIIGAGGFGSHFPEGKIEKVLLLPPKEVYMNRFKLRDDSDESKKAENQNAEEIYDWFKEVVDTKGRHYDRVIEDVASPRETLENIIK